MIERRFARDRERNELKKCNVRAAFRFGGDGDGGGSGTTAAD